MPGPDSSLVDQIDALLPQTQCTRCGFDGCRPYAEAIARGAAAINRCPPGGQAGVAALARLLNIAEPALDPAYGAEGPLRVAVIDEAQCIGCTLCIQACPVDAIVGAAKRMHTVLEDQCTGCELCVAPCPVDCIAMVPAAQAWTPPRAQAARRQHEQRRQRLQAQHQERARLAARTLANQPQLTPAANEDPDMRQARIADALARARRRRHPEARP